MSFDTLRSRPVLIGVVVGLPLSAVLLWLAFRNADVAEVRHAVANADLRFLALAVLAIALVYALQALRWAWIARTEAVSAAGFAEMVIGGVAVNNVLPGRVGDLLRARWLQVAARLPGGRALATVLVDRAFDVLALVVLLLVALPFVAGAEWLWRIALGGVGLLIVVLVVLAVARAYTRRRARDRRSGRSALRSLVRDTLEGLADPLGWSRGVALAGLSLLAWTAWALAASLVARSVGIELSPLEVVFVAAVVNLGVAMPSSPGFIGTYQWLGVSALALVGVGNEEALAFAILMHAVWYVPTTLLGAALLTRRFLGSMVATPRAVATQEAGDV